MSERRAIKAEDQYEEYVLTSVRPCTDGWEIGHDGWIMFCPKGAVEPKVGSKARYYGKGFGYPVRGLDIDGQEVFYRTPEEQEAEQKRQVKESERKQFEEFQRNRESMDKRVAALPKTFQTRIQQFRKANPDFRWKFEGYELFVCEEAVKIAAYAKTEAEIRLLHELEALQKLAGISKDHSGNTFGMACRLAMWHVTKPENVTKEHGALVALVGCEEYGCVHESKEGRP